jgi:hypothetical protein
MNKREMTYSDGFHGILGVFGAEKLPMSFEAQKCENNEL